MIIRRRLRISAKAVPKVQWILNQVQDDDDWKGKSAKLSSSPTGGIGTYILASCCKADCLPPVYSV